MTDEAINPEDLEGEEKAPSKKKKLIFIAGILFVLMAAAGAGVYFFNPFAATDEAAPQEEFVEPDPVFFYPLPEITVNMANVAGRQQYLKIKATLELKDESEVETIEPFLPRILDAFQVYLRELRTTDIEGSAGIFRLKEELQKRINTAIYPAQVQKILFEEIIVQ